MSLEDLKDQLTRSADAVHDMAERLRDELEETRARHVLDRELDALFQELGVEVYQRMRAGEPVEDSVVIQDLVERVAQVEELLDEVEEPPTPPTTDDEPSNTTDPSGA